MRAAFKMLELFVFVSVTAGGFVWRGSKLCVHL